LSNAQFREGPIHNAFADECGSAKPIAPPAVNAAPIIPSDVTTIIVARRPRLGRGRRGGAGTDTAKPEHVVGPDAHALDQHRSGYENRDHLSRVRTVRRADRTAIDRLRIGVTLSRART